MILNCCATALAFVALSGMPVDPNAGESDLTTLRLSQVPEGVNLSWNDTEDLVKGMITPPQLREGRPMVVAVNVATYQGEPFNGPVTLSLRPLDELGGADSQTVTRNAGDRLWTAKFTPRTSGPHRFEVSFRTTHYKVVRAQLEIVGSALPQWLLYAAGATLIVMAVSLGAWLVLRRGVKSS